MPSRETPSGVPAEGTRFDENRGVIVCETCNDEMEEDGCSCVECPGAFGQTAHRFNSSEEGECDNCHRCNAHCECSSCGSWDCSNRVDSVCENCEHCDDCCECVYCERCERSTSEDDICINCGRCYDRGEPCCTCICCVGCGGEFSPAAIACDQCTRCAECACRCGQPEAVHGVDIHGNEGRLPFDVSGGAILDCACRNCNRQREDARIAAAGWIVTPAAERELNTRGYRCKVDFQRRHLIFHNGEATTRVPHTRLVGVEIEVAKAVNSTSVNEACEKWACSIISDGSLPDGTGYEITTAPASGSKLEGMLVDLCEGLRVANATVTQKCGLHVHADTRDLDHRALWRFVRIYQKVEQTLYAVVIPDRWTNQYCEPCGYSWAQTMKNHDQNNPEWLAEELSGYRIKRGELNCIEKFKENAKKNKSIGRRYSGLNLGSHLHRGTVECRIHHGTVDIEKILPWCVLWGGLVQKAKDMTDEEVEALPGEAKQPGDMDRWDKVSFSTLSKLAPNSAIRTWIRTRRRQFMDMAKAAGKWAKPSETGEI